MLVLGISSDLDFSLWVCVIVRFGCKRVSPIGVLG